MTLREKAEAFMREDRRHGGMCDVRGDAFLRKGENHQLRDVRFYSAGYRQAREDVRERANAQCSLNVFTSNPAIHMAKLERIIEDLTK